MMKNKVFKWWCNLTDIERFNIIENAYEDKNEMS